MIQQRRDRRPNQEASKLSRCVVSRSAYTHTVPSQTILDQAAPSQVQDADTWPRVCRCQRTWKFRGKPMESLCSWQKVAGMFGTIDHHHHFGPNSSGIFSRATLEVRLMVFAFSKLFFRLTFLFDIGNEVLVQTQAVFYNALSTV